MGWDLVLYAFILIITCVVFMAYVTRHAHAGAYTGAGRSKSESAVVAALEHITRLPFPPGKPTWLKECGKQLEFDGWNEEHKIALEYSGPLHYKWSPPAESREKFLQRVGRDAYKRALCRTMACELIVVDSELPRDKIYEYLQSRLADISERRGDTKWLRPQNYLPIREATIVV